MRADRPGQANGQSGLFQSFADAGNAVGDFAFVAMTGETFCQGVVRRIDFTARKYGCAADKRHRAGTDQHQNLRGATIGGAAEDDDRRGGARSGRGMRINFERHASLLGVRDAFAKGAEKPMLSELFTFFENDVAC